MSIARRSAEGYPGSPREMHTFAHLRCVRACMRDDSTMRLSAVGLIVTFGLALLVAPLATDAQQPTTLYRIGWLHSGFSAPTPHPSLKAFRQGLRELGYVEG